MARSPFTNPDVESSVSNIEESFRKSFKKIAERLRVLIKAIKTGQGVKNSDAVVAAKIRRMIFSLEDEMGKAGFSDILKDQRAELEKLTKAVLTEAKLLGIPATFSTAEKEQIELLRTGAHRRLSQMGTRAASEIEQILVRSATANVDVDDVVQAIARRLEITETQARTESEKVVSSFHTQTRVERATRSGVDWFLYRGPLDDRTRLFCQRFVGTRVTIAILEEHAGSFGRDPSRVPVAAWLGTFHCRHELVPLVTAERIKRYQIGPR